MFHTLALIHDLASGLILALFAFFATFGVCELIDVMVPPRNVQMNLVMGCLAAVTVVLVSFYIGRS